MFRHIHRWRCHQCGTRALLYLTAIAVLLAEGCGPFPFREAATGTQPATLHSTTTDGDTSEGTVGPAANGGETGEPELTFTASPVFCCNPLSIDFVAKLNPAPPGYSVTFGWDFGDGRTATGAAVRHTYITPGEYPVQLYATVPTWGTRTVAHTLSVTTTSDGVEPDAGDGTGDPDSDTTPGDTQPPEEMEVAPVANAGADQTVEAGQVVHLDGTASTFPQSQPMSFAWRELSGFGIALSNEASIGPTFIAPVQTDGPLTLTFELHMGVGDLWDVDTVNITVLPRLEPPVDPISAGNPVEFLSGCVGTSPPGTVEVSWRFVDGQARSNVVLQQDCCNCRDIDSGPIAPDENGVYHGTVSVPSDGAIWYSVLYRSEGIDYRSQSIYVNPLPGVPGADPPPVIWSHHRNRDPAILYEVARSSVVTHVMIRGSDRVAHPFDDPIVLEEIDICRRAGLKVIWSRHLWNNWGDFQTLEDTLDPSFYAMAVAQVRTEAAALGAEFTAIDCEAYGNAPLDDYLGNDLPPDDFTAMSAAIQEAAVQGQVDFVLPSGSHGRPLHPNNLYPPLGRIRVSKTYWDAPYKNCRITYPYDVFGAYIQPTTERPDMGLFPYFLPQDVVQRRYLWSRVHGAPGTVNGLFLNPGALQSEEERIWEVATMFADFFDSP